MSSSPDKPSSPPQAKNEKLLATLSEAASTKVTDQARQELNRAIEAQGAPSSDPGPKRHDSSGSIRAVREVTEATVKFTDGVDVITETLLLILGKFNTLRRLTMIGMVFGASVLITCLMLTIRLTRTAVLQENTTRDVAQQAIQLKQALAKLDTIQHSTTVTEQKVDQANAKPSIEIIPDKGRPGKAKVVIRSAPTSAPLPPPVALHSAAPKGRAEQDDMPAAAMAPAPADLIEIPIQIPSSAK
jgi:hypothetical protein